MTITLHDVYGTPFRLNLKDSEDYLLLTPPTVRYYETLLTTYAIDLDEAINPPELDDALSIVRMLSRTMQMMHISAILVDPDMTYQDIERLCKEDVDLPAKYLLEFSKFLPESKKEEKSKVASKKSSALPKKIWIPK